MTSVVCELRRRPRQGDIRSDRTVSAEACVLAERAASVRRLRERPHRGMWFVGAPVVRRGDV